MEIILWLTVLNNNTHLLSVVAVLERVEPDGLKNSASYLLYGGLSLRLAESLFFKGNRP